jgi:hypothetical protein
MVKYLFDTNIVFSFFFTTGEKYITPLIESDVGQLKILKDSYPELQNLVQRSFGSQESWNLMNLLLSSNSEAGSYPVLSIIEEDYNDILLLMAKTLSENPISINAKKHDISFIDAALLVVARRNDHVLVTIDKKIHKAVKDSHISVNLLNPYPDKFIPDYNQPFEKNLDNDLVAAKEAKRFIDRLLDRNCDPKIIGDSQRLFSSIIPDFDLVNS